MTYFVPPEKSHPATEFQADARPRFFPGIDSKVMPGLRGSEISITVKPLPGEEIQAIFNRFAAALKELKATIVHLTVFGNIDSSAAGTEAMRRIFGGIDWPVTWIEGAACDGGPIAGLQIFGFAGGEVQRIQMGGCVVGSVFEDGAFRHCLLGGLGPDQKASPRADQTKQTLDILAEALAQWGFQFADVARTWFFLDDILSWYDDFNQARTEIYSGIKFRTGSLPASTGIGAKNPAGAALVAGAWAAQPLNACARIEEVASPLQCPPPAYGSSFSRATEISSAAGRRLFISGTASISPDGKTLCVGDADNQIKQTMEVVETILHSRGFALSDLTRATTYFKHSADARIFREWQSAHGWSSCPVVLANCDICRDNLLFEFESDAWRSNNSD